MNWYFAVLLLVLVCMIAYALLHVHKGVFMGGSLNLPAVLGGKSESEIDELRRIIREWSYHKDDPQLHKALEHDDPVAMIAAVRGVDGHTSYTRNINGKSPAPPKHPLPTIAHKGKTLHITMPGITLGDPNEAEYVHAIDTALEKFKGKKIVIDLRSNEGGNHAPMREGIWRLLPTGTLHSVVYSNGKTYYITRDGEVIDQPTAGKIDEQFANVPVDVIVGPDTASSGEIIAVDLMYNPNTRIIGKPTYGMLSANESIPTRNGILHLKIARVSGPDGLFAHDRIVPK